MFCVTIPTLFVFSLGLQQGSGEGVLMLVDGTKACGKIEKIGNGYRVRTPSRSRKFAAAEVQRFIPKRELLARFDEMAGKEGAGKPFQFAQRALWAFDNGLTERAWPMAGALLAANEKPASLGRLREAAARCLIEQTRRTPNRVELARQLLLGMNSRRRDAVTQAKNWATSQALVELLHAEQEAAQGTGEKADTTVKGKKSVANLCRKYAAEAVSPVRRSAARRALLAFDDGGRKYVWRQTMLWPRGKTRSSIVSEIKDERQADDAALYLTRWLDGGKPTLQVRSAEALGALGSPKALPALHAKRKSIRKSVKRRAGGGGATRGHVAFLETQSYIADFNVEIAQAAAIADPVVRQIQSGVVLDATVGGIVWDRYIIVLDNAVRKAIEEIEGK